MHSKYVEVDGVAVNYIHSGQSTLPETVPDLDRGELIVFLHDAGGNANLWRRQMDGLATAHSSVAIDFPAHGRSGSTDGLSSIEEMAELFAGFADALDLRPFVLVGRGMGASVAVQYGSTHRRRVRGLVLMGTASQVTIDEAVLAEWRDVSRGRCPQPFTKHEFAAAAQLDTMREVWMEQVRTDPRVRLSDLRAWQEVDLAPRLTEVRQPVLVVAGAEDAVVPPDRQQELCPQLPNARLELVRDAGHTVEIEQAEVLAKLVDGFVTSLDRDVEWD